METVLIGTFVTGHAKINHVSAKIANFFRLCCIITYELFIQTQKISVTIAKFNGLSSEIYGNGIPHSELKISAKI